MGRRPQDHEVGAAYCADCIVRAFIPGKIDRPCFFYVKQNDMNFRGDFSLLMANNVPKASYNVLKMFQWALRPLGRAVGGDGEVAGVAAWDQTQAMTRAGSGELPVSSRHPPDVRIQVKSLPEVLNNGTWREWTVDATRSNIWNDPGQPQKAELTEDLSWPITLRDAGTRQNAGAQLGDAGELTPTERGSEKE